MKFKAWILKSVEESKQCQSERGFSRKAPESTGNKSKHGHRGMCQTEGPLQSEQWNKVQGHFTE